MKSVLDMDILVTHLSIAATTHAAGHIIIIVSGVCGISGAL